MKEREEKRGREARRTNGGGTVNEEEGRREEGKRVSALPHACTSQHRFYLWPRSRLPRHCHFGAAWTRAQWRGASRPSPAIISPDRAAKEKIEKLAVGTAITGAIFAVSEILKIASSHVSFFSFFLLLFVT